MANKIASIINAAADELREDNDRAEQRAKLEAMVRRVKGEIELAAKIHKKVFPNGCAVTIEEEKKLMASCFPIVPVK